MLSSKICNRNGATVSEAVSQLKFQQMTFLGPANGTHDQGSKHHALSSSLLHCPLLQEAPQALHSTAFPMFPSKGHGCSLGLTSPKKKKKKNLVGSWCVQYQQKHKLLDQSTDSHPQVVKMAAGAMPKEHRSPALEHPTWAGSNGPRAG